MATHDHQNERGGTYRRMLLSLAGLAALLVSCMADPMPTPGAPDRIKILVSSTASSRNGGPVDLIGVIGLQTSAPGLGEVVLRQPASEITTIAHVAADGTFAAAFVGAAGDRVVITFRETSDGPESEPVDLDVVRFEASKAPETPEAVATGGTASDAGAPSLRSTAPSATPPNGQGRVTVSGQNFDPGKTVAIGNVRTGEVVEVTVAADGTFSTTVAATAGDTLVVIVRDPVTGSTSGMVSLSVGSP